MGVLEDAQMAQGAPQEPMQAPVDPGVDQAAAGVDQGKVDAAYEDASRYVWDEAGFKPLVERADSTGNIPLAVAEYVLQLIKRVEGNMGMLAPEEVFLLAVRLIMEIIDALAQTGREATEADVPEAIKKSVEMWLSKNPDRMSQEQAVGKMQELQAAIDQMPQEEMVEEPVEEVQGAV